MHFLLAAAPTPGPAPASLSFASQAIESVQNNLLSLQTMFEQGLLPVTRSIGLAFAVVMLLIFLIKTFWSYSTGESSSLPMPIGTAVFRFAIVLVLLTGGARASDVGLPDSQGGGGVGALAPWQIAPGDNYTAIAWGIDAMGRGALKAAETGSLSGLMAARQNWSVAIMQPPESTTLPPTESQAQGTATGSTTTNSSQSTRVVIDSTRDVGEQTPTQTRPEGTWGNPLESIGQGVQQVWNAANNSLAGAVINLIQMLLGPVVFIFMMIDRLILLCLWVIGPLTVGLMMYDTKYFKNWVEQYVQVSLWPLITQLMVAMIAFLRTNVEINDSNPAASWMSAAFCLAIFVGLIWVPKIAAFSEGLAASAGGAIAGAVAGTATVAAGVATGGAAMAGQAALTGGTAALTGNTYGFGGVGKAMQRASDSNFLQSRTANYTAGMTTDMKNNSSGKLSQAWQQAKASGYGGDVGGWISEQASLQATRDLRQRQFERKNSFGLAGAGERIDNALAHMAPMAAWVPPGTGGNPSGNDSSGGSGRGPSGGDSRGGSGNGGGSGKGPAPPTPVPSNRAATAKTTESPSATRSASPQTGGSSQVGGSSATVESSQAGGSSTTTGSPPPTVTAATQQTAASPTSRAPADNSPTPSGTLQQSNPTQGDETAASGLAAEGNDQRALRQTASQSQEVVEGDNAPTTSPALERPIVQGAEPPAESPESGDRSRIETPSPGAAFVVATVAERFVGEGETPLQNSASTGGNRPPSPTSSEVGAEVNPNTAIVDVKAVTVAQETPQLAPSGSLPEPASTSGTVSEVPGANKETASVSERPLPPNKGSLQPPEPGLPSSVETAPTNSNTVKSPAPATAAVPADPPPALESTAESKAPGAALSESPPAQDQESPKTRKPAVVKKNPPNWWDR